MIPTGALKMLQLSLVLNAHLDHVACSNSRRSDLWDARHDTSVQHGAAQDQDNGASGVP